MKQSYRAMFAGAAGAFGLGALTQFVYSSKYMGMEMLERSIDSVAAGGLSLAFAAALAFGGAGAVITFSRESASKVAINKGAIIGAFMGAVAGTEVAVNMIEPRVELILWGGEPCQVDGQKLYLSIDSQSHLAKPVCM